MVAWPHPHLAERGQHGADVVEERPVGADDEHAGPLELRAEGVEQPRGAVQADGGLAGAGRPLHADAGADVAAHDLVLLGLDRRDDVAHRAGAGALDLGGEDGAVVGAVAGGEALVLVGREPAAVDAEPPTQLDAHRLGGRGPVERRGDRGAPVDDDRVAAVVARRAGARCGRSPRRARCGCRSGRRTSVVRGSSCSEATRRASTRPSSSLVQASVALAASSRSVASRIRRSWSRAWSRWACSRASTSSVAVGGVGGRRGHGGSASRPGLVRILANR